MSTLQDALRQATAAGLHRLDAQMLLLHALGRTPHDRAPDPPLTDAPYLTDPEGNGVEIYADNLVFNGAVVLGQNLGADAESAGRLALMEAERIRAALEAPYAIGSREYASTGSIGITLFPKHGEAAEDLLREADTAMYGAKGLGRNRVRFFELAMQAEVQQRMALEQDLGRALAEAVFSRPGGRRGFLPRPRRGRCRAGPARTGTCPPGGLLQPGRCWQCRRRRSAGRRSGSGC